MGLRNETLADLVAVMGAVDGDRFGVEVVSIYGRSSAQRWYPWREVQAGALVAPDCWSIGPIAADSYGAAMAYALEQYNGILTDRKQVTLEASIYGRRAFAVRHLSNHSGADRDSGWRVFDDAGVFLGGLAEPAAA